MKKKGIIVSGYFNPLHKGHLEYFSLSKTMGDELIVIVNNDFQRQLKGSKEFMLEDERYIIISNIKNVDKVYISIDKDKSVQKTIEFIFNELNEELDLFFANGGDQVNDFILERNICGKLGIGLIDNLGEKVQSSSWLLKKLK
tara:strand:+ start:128 stop:556 length:429 start_codon:yes stop_codon:yes gene_type:complete